MADTKLHTAVRYGNEEETLQALKEGFDPNELGMLRWSSVHEASHNGERDILKLLLLFKGDVNQKDGLHGNTPLHYAAQEDNSACVTVLLNAGAKLDIKNDQGRTPLDLATSSCLERMEPFVNNGQNTVGEDWQPGGPTTKGSRDQTRWQGLDDVPSNAAIGSLHLSFEFHKSALKVRVWQITDLLLPPPQTSMIESIFVRGYLIPDTAKKTQRKTEEIRVDPNPKKDNSRPSSTPQQGGIQHIFTPSSFRFDNPLMYTGVTDEIVSQRSIQLEVCMIQKQTHKPFLMAMLHMPLSTAVRRPIREKYPLIPCMNYTIPNSMRVYSAKDIFVEGTSQIAGGGGVRRSDSLQSNPDSTYSGSSTDTSHTLQDIRVDSSCVPAQSQGRKLISVNISDSFCDDDDDDNTDDEGGGRVGGPRKKCSGDDEEKKEENMNDGIGSSLDVVICSGKGSSESSSVVVDMLENSVNEDLENMTNSEQVLDSVVVDRTVIGSSGLNKETSIIDMGKDSHQPALSMAVDKGSNTTKKKRIIPNELLVKSPDVEDDDDVNDDDSSTVIVVDQPVMETVVDMTRLSTDMVVDMDMMTDSGYDNESVQSENSPISENKETTTTTASPSSSSSSNNKSRKRIIPMEINCDKISVSCVEDDDDEDRYEDDELNKEMTNIHSEGLPNSLSPKSAEDKSSSTPVTGSRPETPVWDFYDFACDNGTNPASLDEPSEPLSQNDPNNSANSCLPNSTSSSSSSSNVKASSLSSSSANTGTLQESLARLSRPQQVLDTCHVSGPVLPSIIMMEDLDMEEEET